MKKIVIIGAGVMGKIFLRAILKTYPAIHVTITDKNPTGLKQIKKKFPLITISLDNKTAIKNASLIVLAVKPQSFTELIKELRGLIPPDSIVLSIMAGIKINRIKNQLKVKKVIRAMPNLGARIKKSMTVWTATDTVNKIEKKNILLLFKEIGQELYVQKEEKINKATALSGSGPGFFFYLIECWLSAAQSLGFSSAEAKYLIFNTIDAANDLLKIYKNPSELRQQVSSKGGTTEAGLRVMADNDTLKIWAKTLAAAYKRATELSKNS